MIIETGIYKLDVDIDRTRRFYETAGGSLDCDCAGCRNFRKAYPLIDREIQAYFRQFGVDMGKPAEMTAIVSQDGSRTLYDGFYHICGRIPDGREPFIQVDGKHYRLDESATVPLNTDSYVFFTSRCGLLEAGFPTPAIQIEVFFHLPWLLEEPNPYHYPDLPDLKEASS